MKKILMLVLAGAAGAATQDAGSTMAFFRVGPRPTVAIPWGDGPCRIYYPDGGLEDDRGHLCEALKKSLRGSFQGW